jgi:hypothetical protein
MTKLKLLTKSEAEWLVKNTDPKDIVRELRERGFIAPEPVDPLLEIEALRAENERLREALVMIQNEAERENGRWVHLKRCIAVQSRAALKDSQP